MSATIHHLPARTPDPLLLPAARALHSEGITPGALLACGPSDRTIRAIAAELEDFHAQVAALRLDRRDPHLRFSALTALEQSRSRA